MNVSIVIPTYHDWKRLGLCLEALSNQSVNENEYEVIVVNNDLYDSCPFDLPSENMTLVYEPMPGSYAARNTGIRQSKGEIIGFTDSDCIPDRDWIQNALQVFDHFDVDRVAGHISIFKEENASELIFQYERNFALDQQKYVDRMQSALTANLFVRRDVFDRVGYFNENLYSGGDNEWGRRAAEFGIKIVYASDVIVNHPSRKTMRQLIQKKRRTTGGDFQIIIPELGFQNKIKKIVRQLLPPIEKYRNSDPSHGWSLKIRMVGIAWINNLVGLCEWARLLLLKGRRFRR